MLDEPDRRRPHFRRGLDLCLANGQAWSLPIPDETAVDLDGPRAEWDGPVYRAILHAVMDAEDDGELFRAELALAIHLLKWNYAVDGDDLRTLLEDRDQAGSRAPVDLSGLVHELASAHVEPKAGRAEGGRRPGFGMKGDEISRLIGLAASPVIGPRRGREAEGQPT